MSIGPGLDRPFRPPPPWGRDVETCDVSDGTVINAVLSQSAIRSRTVAYRRALELYETEGFEALERGLGLHEDSVDWTKWAGINREAAKVVVEAIGYAVKNGWGLSFSWIESKEDRTAEIKAPHSWDGDTIPLLMIGRHPADEAPRKKER